MKRMIWKWEMSFLASFTHFNEEGRPRMVDISAKESTSREALAQSSIRVNQTIYNRITANEIAKGDVFSVAQIAGIMGAKNTPDIIPMCHPLQLKGIDLSFKWEVDEKADIYDIIIQAEVKTKGNTGVEMEALTAASVAALTIYDMVKAVDKGMVIGHTYLVEKTGGKSGDFLRSSEVQD